MVPEVHIGPQLADAGAGPASRHEIAYVHHSGKFYLTGDRGYLLNEVFDAATKLEHDNTAPEGSPPRAGRGAEGSIYYLGGLAGPYPDQSVPLSAF